jgi:hypothetical protein
MPCFGVKITLKLESLKNTVFVDESNQKLVPRSKESTKCFGHVVVVLVVKDLKLSYKNFLSFICHDL